MFKEVRAWFQRELKRDNVIRLASKLNLSVSIVENEISFYDTLCMLSEILPCKPILGENVAVNRVFAKVPRFDWRIDFYFDRSLSEKINIGELNDEAYRRGYIHEISLGEYRLKLGKLKITRATREKIILERICSSYNVGLDLTKYLKDEGVDYSKFAESILEMKAYCKGMPHINPVKVEIILSNVNKRFLSTVSVKSLLDKVLKPVRKASANVYPPEIYFVDLIYRLVMEESITEKMGIVYDLGQLITYMEEKCNLALIDHRYVEYLSKGLLPLRHEIVKKVKEKIADISHRKFDFNVRTEYMLACREYLWEEYCRMVCEGVERILG
ncbi:MAG TPA: hypothetical protein ENG22_04840 [Candidatus Bathyarchaeota archaeon]|nr:hypothetical protein [Candidatus Bathyarchaeota archaeon]